MIIGTHIGKYEIVAHAGSGGMADVYKARQPSLDRFVALKLLHSFLAQRDDHLKRFQREAQSIAQLHNPNIVQVYDFDQFENHLYMVMEYIEGHSLKEILSGQSIDNTHLSLDDSLQIFREVCKALAYAHKRNIVHRDVKPGNVMIAQDGRVVLTDFGLVKILSNPNQTASDSLMGTPAYMSPEQCRGETGDHRIDIYALGVMLYEMVVGQQPFVMDTPMGLMMQHIGEHPPYPTTLNSAVPLWLEKIILKAMAKRPADRYQTVEAMLRDLAEGSLQTIEHRSQRVISQSGAEISETKKLKQAIAALEAQRSLLGDDVVEVGIAPLRRKLEELQGELATPPQRKLVTIVLTQITNALNISQNLDAEDAAVILQNGLGRIDTLLRQYGGVAMHYTGNGITAVFGIPLSRENDAERAVHAGLAILDAAQNYANQLEQQWALIDFSVHVTIHTGLATVSNSQDIAKMLAGPTVNLALAVDQITPTGQLLITHETYRHIRGIFDTELFDTVSLPGSTRPIKAYIVHRAKARAFRMLQRGIEGIETNMVGREAEFSALQDAFYLVVEEHEQQIVTIVGDAGVGKSRLLVEFSDWVDLQPEEVFFFKGRSNQEMQNLPYALIRDLFSFRFQIKDNDAAATVRQKFETGIINRLGPGQSSQMQAHFMGQLIGFDFSSSPYLQGIVSDESIVRTPTGNTPLSEHLFQELGDARQLRNRAQEYLINYFKRTAQELPTLIVLEDIHWADDSSLDFVSQLILETADSRLLFLMAARPTLFESRPHWGEGQTSHTMRTLTPLSRRESNQLVREVLNKVDIIPGELKKIIVERGEGNPLYIEELVKMLIEDEVILPADESWKIELARLNELSIPTTLIGIIQARLDSLEPEHRGDLQRASIIGRVFWDGALHSMREDDTDFNELLHSLKILRTREFIFHRENSTISNAEEYIFKHAILRDATYQTILKNARQHYHQLVAQWLIEHSADRLNEFTGLVAEHLLQAGETNKSINYLRHAGEKAAAQFANKEAITFFSRALELCSEDNFVLRYTLLLAREAVYNVQGNRAAQEQDLAELLKIVGKFEDQARDAQVMLRQSGFFLLTNKFSEAIEVAQKIVDIGQQLSMPSIEASGLLNIGQAYFRSNEFEEAKPYFEQAKRLATASDLPKIEADCFRWFGGVAIFQGHLDTAKAYCEQALQLYQKLGDRRSEGGMFNNLGMVACRQIDFAGAQNFFEQSIQVMRETGERWGESLALCNLGELYYIQQAFEVSARYCQDAVAMAKTLNYYPTEGIALMRLGHAQLGLGDFMEAETAYKQGIKIFEELKQDDMALECKAGLAKAKLLGNDLDQATALVEVIFPFLEQYNLEGLLDPFRIHMFCFDVFQAVDDARAEYVLRHAYQNLQILADNFHNSETAVTFLEQVPAHKRIIDLYLQLESPE